MILTWRKASRATRRTSGGILCLIILAIALIQTVPAIERIAVQGRPTCTLKIFTGIPCLGCRGTRAGFAFGKGQIGRAIAYNPLATLLGIVVTGWSVMVATAGRLPSFHLTKPGQNLAWVLFVFALIGNWIYVIAAGG